MLCPALPPRQAQAPVQDVGRLSAALRLLPVGCTCYHGEEVAGCGTTLPPRREMPESKPTVDVALHGVALRPTRLLCYRAQDGRRAAGAAPPLPLGLRVVSLGCEGVLATAVLHGGLEPRSSDWTCNQCEATHASFFPPLARDDHEVADSASVSVRSMHSTRELGGACSWKFVGSHGSVCAHPCLPGHALLSALSWHALHLTWLCPPAVQTSDNLDGATRREWEARKRSGVKVCGTCAPVHASW